MDEKDTKRRISRMLKLSVFAFAALLVVAFGFASLIVHAQNTKLQQPSNLTLVCSSYGPMTSVPSTSEFCMYGGNELVWSLTMTNNKYIRVFYWGFSNEHDSSQQGVVYQTNSTIVPNSTAVVCAPVNGGQGYAQCLYINYASWYKRNNMLWINIGANGYEVPIVSGS